jgi:hypothetical protein
MIAGQSPRLVWRDNPGGEIRSLEEAIEIAQKHGVVIPDDVRFVIDTIGDLGPEVMARGPLVRLPDQETASWSDLVHPRTGKVPFRLWSGILKSDEAIVAVIAHEMFELELARPFLVEGGVPIGLFIERTCPGVTGNWHDQAWDFADQLVERMRKGQP